MKDAPMFEKVVVANRGAVAARVIRALRKLGIRSVAVYSEADRDLPYLTTADEAHLIGPPAPAASYLNQEAILGVLKRTGADGLHPGYGFLAENHGFAAGVIAAGARFIGPSPRWIDAMGHKTRARELMARLGMPMSPSSGLLSGAMEEALTEARRIGFPVLVKPAAGGGGIGMLPARNEQELTNALDRARSLATRSFGNAEIYLEKLIARPRHVEFQVLGDTTGAVRHLFERDCSIQRRHQKVIEEAPAPLIPRSDVHAVADRIASILRELGYDNIGTVEMLFDSAAGFGFLEMNTRLQVEHAVTEEITGIDLVTAQVRLASGHPLGAVLPDAIAVHGHAIEARIYAEDPTRFFPSPGPLTTFRPPVGPDIRVETGYREGNTVTPYYDPLIAKVIVRGPDRARAITSMLEALDTFAVEGVRTNIPFVQKVLESGAFRGGLLHTGLGAQLLTSSNAASSSPPG
jgi:acetyl-CoA carboxylase, biotin carboxylase subunit